MHLSEPMPEHDRLRREAELGMLLEYADAQERYREALMARRAGNQPAARLTYEARLRPPNEVREIRERRESLIPLGARAPEELA